MTIDTNELRRLAQAATPHVGHACKYQDAHWLREGHVDFENADLFIASERPQEDAAFYAAANPAAISELLDRLEVAEKEVTLKERIIDALGSELNAVAKERDALRTALEKIADWDSAWGPYPETNEAWRAMVIVTAREAVPRRGEEK